MDNLVPFQLLKFPERLAAHTALIEPHPSVVAGMLLQGRNGVEFLFVQKNIVQLNHHTSKIK